MPGQEPRLVLDRLRGITWDEDFDVSLQHARSRAMLMREFLRRAALWARQYHAESAWPFFDLAPYVDASLTLETGISAELDDYLRLQIGTPSIGRTCRGAVHWAAVRSETTADLPALPDLYEPWLLMVERGGGYAVGQFIDLQGVAIPRGTLEKNLTATPFLTLARPTLDALDSQGRVTYYAKISPDYPRSRPRGLVRRRLVGGDEQHDEAFTRNLRWEPTEYLRRYALGHNDVDHVEITEAEAGAFIQSAIENLAPGH